MKEIESIINNLPKQKAPDPELSDYGKFARYKVNIQSQSLCCIPVMNKWNLKLTLNTTYITTTPPKRNQIRSVTQLCPTLCDPMNRSMPGLPVHHQLQEFTEIHIHRVSDAIQPSHSLSSPSPPAPNPSQHQSLFQ